MADWGAFLQGLSRTTAQAPNLIANTAALRQRDEALAREEKRLVEQVKKQEINEAQQSLYKGLEWSEKLSDDVKPQIIDSMIVPAIKTLTKHNIMSYNDEQVQEFATKLKGNVTVGGQFMKDFRNIIDLNTDKKTGSVNYKAIIQGMDMLLPTYGKKLTENEMKVAEVQKQNVARQAVTDPNTTEQDKQFAASYLPKAAQDALGMGKQEEVWGEPYTENGVVLQKNNRGKIRQVVNPKEGGAADELSKNIKMDKYHSSLVQQAMSQAGKEAGLKFNTQPVIQLGGDGKPVISFPNNPEAHAFYVKRVGELSDQKVRQAVKRKALSKDYLPEEVPSAPKQSMPKAGDVVDGWKFKGGNPADKNNWEKQ